MGESGCQRFASLECVDHHRVSHLKVHNVRIRSGDVVSARRERRRSVEHLVGADTQRPPVALLAKLALGAVGVEASQGLR